MGRLERTLKKGCVVDLKYSIQISSGHGAKKILFTGTKEECQKHFKEELRSGCFIDHNDFEWNCELIQSKEECTMSNKYQLKFSSNSQARAHKFIVLHALATLYELNLIQKTYYTKVKKGTIKLDKADQYIAKFAEINVYTKNNQYVARMIIKEEEKCQ